MRTFESEPMQMRDRPCPDALGRDGSRRRDRPPVVGHDADDRSRRGEEVELGTVRVGRVHDRRALGEAARAREELDRAAAVLGEALLDLLRLLVGVDVERERRARARTARSPRASRRGTRGRSGGDSDAQPGIAQPLDLLDELRDRLLAKAAETSARVGDVEEDELDACCRRRLGRRQCASTKPR